MARRRSAAALFEVIHSDNRFPSRHGSGWTSWSLPRWLRRRERSAAAAADVAAPAYDPPPRAERAPREPWRLPTFLLPRIGMSLDPDRQVVSFKMSYTAAIVSAFALMLTMALAYTLGKQNGVKPGPALAELTTDDLRNGPAQASVLDIPGGGEAPQVALAAAPLPTRTAAGAAAAPPAAPAAPSAARSQPGARPAAAAAAAAILNDPKPPATFYVTDARRTVGLHYVIVQSYPPEEQKLAEEACQLLNRNGVLCTVEKGVSFAPRWFTVVGITGFVRVKNSPEYDQYVAKIQQTGEKFGGGSKFKKFEPKAFKWRDPKVQ